MFVLQCGSRCSHTTLISTRQMRSCFTHCWAFNPSPQTAHTPPVPWQRLGAALPLRPGPRRVIQHRVEERLRFTGASTRDHQRRLWATSTLIIPAAQTPERLRLMVVRREPFRHPIQNPVPPDRARIRQQRTHIRAVKHPPLRVL